ncbi:MAG: M23 family metallopeptidase [Anaerolineaceae bacterium]|nr:M23 family metallopeptidase [Anaerolineaceae bacterium]
MKTRFKDNTFAFILVFMLWMLSILACSRSVQYKEPLSTAYIPTNISVIEENSENNGDGLIGGGATALDAPTFIPQESEATLESIEDITEVTEEVITAIPQSTPTEEATPDPQITPEEKQPIMYLTQAGDTIDLLSLRFEVEPDEIIAPSEIRRDGMLMPDQLLIIPDVLNPDTTTSNLKIMPDTMVVYSPATMDFDIEDYITEAGGYLAEYNEWGKNGWRSGADVIEVLSSENSINPMLLLAILDSQSNWVTSNPSSFLTMDYPMGYPEFEDKGLYKQVNWAIKELSIGYYHWRSGDMTAIRFKDGSQIRLNPELNAGTVAVMYLYAQILPYDQWKEVMYSDNGIIKIYERMFGNPFENSIMFEPIFPSNLAQPPLELPFKVGPLWSFSGGPHSAWDEGGAKAALDFAPSAQESGCVDSPEWVTAVADGLIIESGNGIVKLDLDGDGHEQTGWVILYLHIGTQGRISNGMWVKQGDIIGHPSCEGGRSTGTHVHIARKYNGEWILADKQMPFVMSGWQAYSGNAPYEGTLIKGDTIVSANTNGSYPTRISR